MEYADEYGIKQPTATIVKEVEAMADEETAMQEAEKIVSSDRITTSVSSVSLKIDDSRIIQKMLKAIVPFGDEAIIKVSKDGLSIMKPDDSGIALIKAFIPNRNWFKFETSGEVELGINIANAEKGISQIFKKCDTLMIEEFNTKVSFTGIYATSRKKLSVPTIEIKKEGMHEPICEYKATLEINAGTLKDAFRDASFMSSYATLTAHSIGRELNITSKGDAGIHEESYAIDGKYFVSGDMQSATYNLDYLLNCLKAVDRKAKVELSFSNKEVLRMQYTTGEVNITVYLAPYMDD